MAKRYTVAERAAKEKEAKAAKRRAGRADRRARKNAAIAQDAPPITAKDVGARGIPTLSHVKAARMALVEAFDLLGGVPQLVKWGKANLTEFYRIWSRLIPKEAAEEQTNSLEVLLAELAKRGDQPVALAAYEIGAAKMQAGKEGADAEDAALALTAFEREGTLQ